MPLAQKFVTGQKVAVADHEEQRALLRRLAQHGSAFGFEAAGLIECIVTHPDFKQIAEDKDGIGR
jgi:hypothetical protein